MERKRFQSGALLLLMLPGLGYFLLFHYGALVGNVIAFKEYVPFDGIWGSPWVGLGNFQRMFEDEAFWHSVLNTLWISVLQLVFFFPVPLALAGFAAAAGLFKGVIGALLVYAANKVAHRLGEQGVYK